MPIRLTEPHPTATHKMTYGRGGAGNSTRVTPPPTSLTTTRLANSTPHFASNSHKYTTGRGGAGNLHSGSEERPMFRFDEELERERMKGEAAPVYHVGRGGSGNAINERRTSSGSDTSEGSRASVRGSLDWMRGVVKKI